MPARMVPQQQPESAQPAPSPVTVTEAAHPSITEASSQMKRPLESPVNTITSPAMAVSAPDTKRLKTEEEVVTQN